MLQLSILEILSNPHENGITIFILGALFVLCLYHFLLYFQHKDKAYLYYSLYGSLLFLRCLHEPQNSFINQIDVLQPFLELTHYYSLNLEWAYNTVYFIFAFTFIDLKSYSKKWHTFIFSTVAFLLCLNILVEVICITADFKQIYGVFRWVFIILLLVLSIVGYVPLFKIKGNLKYYIIVGSLSFLFFSILAFIVSKYGLINKGSQIAVTIFYVGAIIENLCFSLGLGQKQKQILKAKNVSQEKLINQLQENEKLRTTVQQQLKKEVSILNQQVAIDKHEKIKAQYDKELAELKIISLRSQMNPHFIFNSLNAIKLYIIDNEKENAVYYLNKFSKLIRKILASTREKQITLAEEIETIKLYIDIENIRFNNEIEATFTIDETLSLDTIKIPSLILQPFVENAIWHGLSLQKEQKKLHVVIRKKGKTHIEIRIEDNGIGREKSSLIKQKKLYKKESIGINLTKERLSNFEKDYTHNYSLRFEDLYDEHKKASGTTVVLDIPLL